MRIGIDIRLIGKKRTGDEQVFFNLVKNLAEIDQSNQYFLFTDRDPKQDNELEAETDKLNLKNNFKIIFINAPNRFWWNFWALPDHLRKNPVDVFHTQYIAPIWLPKKIKLVLTIHDISFNFFPQFIKKSDLFFLKTLIPRSFKMAAKIIAVSEFTKNEIEKNYRIPAKKIAAIHNGVNFDFFNQYVAPEKLKEIGKKYNLPDKFILYIGTLQPRKNIPILIKAMRHLDIKLVLAGNKKAHNFDPRIDKTIKKYNLQEKIVFPGWIDEEDKPALFKLARCFVFPSLYEGFGIPIIEAMSAGAPVVCSDIPALREISRDAALLCNPKNNQELSKNILKILTDQQLKERLIQSGIETAQKFTWQKTAKNMLEIYEELAQ
jgi:glycosyltransferase involved in cell wall biosynthesis